MDRRGIGDVDLLTVGVWLFFVQHQFDGTNCYRLGECLACHPELRDINRLTLRDSLRCARLALWDERKRRLVRFGNAGS